MYIKKGMILKVIDKPAGDWVEGMKKFCGQVVTVESVLSSENICIKEDKSRYTWFASDFVPASNEDVSRHLREMF